MGISLLDCTLRDGGYLNDWNFGRDAIADIIARLSHSGVEILELGFLRDEPYQADRTIFPSMEQVKTVMGQKHPGVIYSVMAEVANPFPVEKLAPADPEAADIIRVVLWKTKHDADGHVVDALEEGWQYCNGVVEKGYRLCVQPARVSQYSDEEFTAMVKHFSELSPYAIYVVDSWGTQNAEELLHYMHLADQTMPAGIRMGYHGHNNMMQALSVAQAMIKERFSRDIIIDASVYGIGRGAGNLNLELIAKYLNEHGGKHYDLEAFLEVYSRYVKAVYAATPWGYSIPYYLTAKYDCNPAYAGALKDAETMRIVAFLESLAPKDRVMFNRMNVKEWMERHE